MSIIPNVQPKYSHRIAQGDIFKNVQFIEKAEIKNGLVHLDFITFPYALVLTQDCDLEQEKNEFIKEQNKQPDSDLWNSIHRKLILKSVNISLPKNEKAMSTFTANAWDFIYDNYEYLNQDKFIQLKDNSTIKDFIASLDIPPKSVWEQLCTLRTEYDKKLISVLVVPLYNYEHFKLGEHLSELGYYRNPSATKDLGLNNIENNSNPRYHYFKFNDAVNLTNMIADFKHYFTVTSEYLNKHINQKVFSLPELYREQVSQRFSAFLSRIGLPD